ncbi:hypothetical protein FEM48_Zijuj07G0039300 [Ziziphus jujuba var. spinosa]|uniref:Uncharacterized protein n=1 Tax=Ziziphus jujuba var. spinosa TaxID=714518 RepID=A0A978V2A9_ZIZJJ|nr:hypothetical protein FEM48_Zijuj07G0039300 [Ziziphus jujuba var. spinosa]
MDEPVLFALNEPVDSLLDSPIEDDDNARLYESDKDEEDDDNALYERFKVQGSDNAFRQNVGNGADSFLGSVESHAAKKNVGNGVGTSVGSTEVYNNEGNVGRAPTFGPKNVNSIEEVHYDYDDLVNLASSDEDGDTMTLPIYSSLDDLLKLSVGMKENPKMKFAHLQSKAKQDIIVGISNSQAYRAKVKANAQAAGDVAP